MSLVVVDACGANINSVLGALRRLGCDPDVTKAADTIRSAERVIMPGVGAAGNAMQRLNEHNLTELIPSLTQPVLGICVGMQVLFAGSEEDDVDCLGIFNERLTKFTEVPERPIPHMGWNRLDFNCERKHPLLNGLTNDSWCYFVHSFRAATFEHTVAGCDYGEPFSAVVAKDNFMGVQFHPERSAATGARVLDNFLNLPL